MTLSPPTATPNTVRSVFFAPGRPDLLASKPELFTFQEVAPAEKGDTERIDLIHSNSIEWMRRPQLAEKNPLYEPSNILFCTRHQDVIAVANWETKELVWAWGQGEIVGPHDAMVLDDGHILLFDNGIGRGWSRVIELDPLTEQIVWEYRAPQPEDFYTESRGSNQRLPNGNTLLACSDFGRALEITSDGQMVWEFLNPAVNQESRRASIVRMTRYQPAYVERILEQFDTPAATPQP